MVFLFFAYVADPPPFNCFVYEGGRYPSALEQCSPHGNDILGCIDGHAMQPVIIDDIMQERTP